MSTTTVSPAATTGMAGGALWALLPVAWAAASFDDVEFGTLAWFGVAAAAWIFAVLPPALIAVGLTALRRALGDGTPRIARAGIVVSAVGLASMTLGNGIEIASMTAGHGEVALGHALFLIGFLVSVVGSIVVGVVVFRRRSDAPSRVAGMLLALALPLGIGIAILGSAIAPGSDAGFWAAIAVPTGLAWILLGRSLRSGEVAGTRELAAA
ncbi:MAG: rane protein of unknown function [Blastococcus sp.]|jgi:hypothetical protein|nr:rane protein of unknown function [Blastococcus sp.]